MPVLNCLPLAALLLLIAIAKGVSISRFDIVNVDTKATVRPLVPNDVLSFDHPFALVAVLDPLDAAIPSVTFTRPYHAVERFAPYALPGDYPSGVFHPLNVDPNVQLKVSAFVGADPDNSRTVPFSVAPPGFPARGPLPWEVVPTIDSPEVTDIRAPTIAPRCTLEKPQVTSISIWPSYYEFGNAQVNFDVKWCPGLNSLRVRALSYASVTLVNGDKDVKTSILYADTRDFFQSGQVFVLVPKCEPTLIFVEVCGRRPGIARPLCGTSRIVTMFRRWLKQPSVTARAPLTLRLKPGDSPIVQYKVESNTTPLGSSTAQFRFQVAARARDGYYLGNSPWTTQTVVRAKLPLRGAGGMKAADYDGATVFLRYSYVSCPTGIDALRSRDDATKVVVRDDVSSLIRQDDALPVVGNLTFPPTEPNTAVTLSIEASNPGSGRRADGASTKLSYQWYLQDTGYGFAPSFPEPITGATSSSYFIPNQGCYSPSCGRHGCTGLAWYSVAVCNTLGCVRSNTAEPSSRPGGC